MHRPFHSGGHHRSDDDEDGDFQKRRSAWLTLLEDHGVDLVLQGHNHVYERSYLLDNLIGTTRTLTPANKVDTSLGREDGTGAYRKKKSAPHQGTIFVTIPGGGVASGDFERYSIFPVFYSGRGREGSVVVDVDGARMDVTFLCDESDSRGSHVWDHFTIVKND